MKTKTEKPKPEEVPEIGVAVPMPGIPEIEPKDSPDYFVIHQAADGNWKGKRVHRDKVTESRAGSPDTALLELITLG
jgi:hypothetical protein